MKRVLLFIMTLLIFACSNPDPGDQAMSSEERLTYIQAHSGGMQTVDGPIRLLLNKAIDVEEKENKVHFHIEPQHELEVVWTGNQEIEFRPIKPFKPNQAYTLSVDLSEIYPEWQSGSYYALEIYTPERALRYEGGDLKPIGNSGEMVFEGRIVSSGFSSKEIPAISIRAHHYGKDLAVEWSTLGSSERIFQISGIKRELEASQLFVELEGEYLSVKEEKWEYWVPQKDAMEVVKAVVDSKADPVVIEVHFSNVLKRNQDLTGLIKLDKIGPFKSVISGHVIKIFSSKITSKMVELKVLPGIVDEGGARSQGQFASELEMGEIKPKIKFPDQGKSILAGADFSVISFEAIHLKSVVIAIEKIHSHNVLQHLQVNQLDGDYQLSRVGELKSIHRVPLAAAAKNGLHKWNQYEVDLSTYFQQEPGAIYKISLQYYLEDASARCGDTENDVDKLMKGNEQERLRKQFLKGFSWRNYNWKERNDPCKSSFYRQDRWKSLMVMSTPMSLIAKQDVKKKLTVWVTDIKSGTPLSNVSVGIYNYQQRIIGEGTTNDEGQMDWDGTEEQAYFIVAQRQKDKAYLSLTPGENISLSPFMVSGNAVNKDGAGFIYAERGIWRPGDTLFIDFMRDMRAYQQGEMPPVIGELYDPNGLRIHREVGFNHVGGIYSFAWTTDSDAPTGNWKAVVKMGEATLTKALKVETIKPNKLEVAVSIDPVINYTGKKQKFELKSSWLTGAKHGGYRMEVERRMDEIPLVLPEWKNYSFNRDYQLWSSSKEVLIEGITNSEGVLTKELDFKETRKASGPVKILLTGKSYEPSGDFSLFSHGFLVYPFDHYTGIKLPESKWHSLNGEKDQDFELITVDKQGEIVSGDKIKIMVKHSSWSWWWDRTNRRGSYNYDKDNKVVLTQEITSTEGPQIFTIPAKKLERGRYILLVENVSSGHRSASEFYIHKGERWWDDMEAQDGPSILSFDLKEEKVEVGSPIEIEVPTEKGSRLLMTIESGNGIIQNAWIPTEKEMTKIKLNATREMMPNSYVSLHLIHPLSKSKGGRALRSFGVKPIEVVDREMVLQPVISVANEMEPEAELNFSITEKDGKEMAYTVAIVDEGLLNLTNFRTPDPQKAFWSKQSLGVMTWDQYDRIFGVQNGVGNRVLTVGGDAGVELGGLKEVSRFKPVVRHLGPFKLAKGGQNDHSVFIPPYMGKLRLMVVAGHRGKYGNAEANIRVREELMVLGTAPRVLTPGDRFSVPVTVFNMMDNSKKVALKMEVDGGLVINEDANQFINVEAQSNGTTTFALTAPSTESNVKLKITASQGGKSSTHELDIAVRANAALQTFTKDTIIAPGKKVVWNYVPVGLPSSNGGYVELSNRPSLNLGERYRYLLGYPYGCSEQLTSLLMAQLNLSKFKDLSKAEKIRLNENIQAGINKLRRRQAPNGGIYFWPGSNTVNSYVSVYLAHALIIAEQSGFGVDKVFKDNLLKFLAKEANSWDGRVDSNNDLIQGYRLFILAKNKMASVGAMNRMKNMGLNSREARGFLALSYIISGYPTVGQEILKKPILDNRYYRYYYGGKHRLKAIDLLINSALKRETTSFELALDIAKMVGSKEYLNTHELTWSLLALADGLQMDDQGELSMNAVVSANEGVTPIVGDALVQQWQVNETNGMHQIIISNNGTKPIHARSARSGKPLRQVDLPTISDNLSLKVEYKNKSGQKLDVRSVEQGELIQAKVFLKLKGDQYRSVRDVALTHIVPSGWEIVNDRVLTDKAQVGSKYKYLDIRDDRLIYHFDLNEKELVFNMEFIATYVGDFYLPPVLAEAMYVDDVYASNEAYLVRVTK